MYVDGLNLYYGMMKRSPRGRKWLDFETLARRLFPNEDIAEIHYFTTRIKELDDPDAPNRQRMYLEALGSSHRSQSITAFSGSTRRCANSSRRRRKAPRSSKS